MVDVHSARRPVGVAKEGGVSRFGSVLAHRARRGPDAARARKVLVARAAHLALRRRVGHVAQDAAVEALWFLNRFKV